MSSTLEITDEERDVLWAILYHTVGGDEDGPRKHAKSLLDKLACGHGRFSARIEVITRWQSRAVVVRERK
jgi:hypothetical protein